MKNLYLGINEQIKTMCPLIKYRGMWNNQVNDMVDEKGQKVYSFQLPATFIEFVNDNPVDSVGGGVQIYDPCDIKIHIVHDFYDAQDGTMEVNLEIFDIEQQIHDALQLFAVKGDDYGSGPFSRVSQERDYDHSNVYHSIPTYRTTWTDNSRSQPVGGYEIDPPLTLDLTVAILP